MQCNTIDNTVRNRVTYPSTSVVLEGAILFRAMTPLVSRETSYYPDRQKKLVVRHRFLLPFGVSISMGTALLKEGLCGSAKQTLLVSSNDQSQRHSWEYQREREPARSSMVTPAGDVAGIRGAEVGYRFLPLHNNLRHPW